MAGKGGGAWKVAYADFVTAMMAFFLVMWIVAQDQQTKQAISHYFTDPMGTRPFGTSNQPGASGAMFEVPKHGDVPESKSVAMGQGRNSHTGKGEHGPTTKIVSDAILTDDGAFDHWRTQARDCRDQAAASPDVRERGASAETAAVRLLAQRLREEFQRKLPEGAGVNRDLLLATLADVNWIEIAEDVLAQVE